MGAIGDDGSEPYNYFREWHLLIRKRILKLRATYGGSSRSRGQIEIKIAREQNRRVPRRLATQRTGINSNLKGRTRQFGWCRSPQPKFHFFQSSPQTL
jgi:hypothetical protein